MRVEHLEILVEEQSMEVLLRTLLPRVLPATSFRVLPHQGKLDLLKKLPGKLAAYASYLQPAHRVLIVVDRDRDDCVELKARIEAMARKAGLATRRTSPTNWRMACRIVVEELEAWYFGDWEAVRAAYPKLSMNVPRKAAFRDSDEIQGGTHEAFERLVQDAGYFSNGFRKIEAARRIGVHMNIGRNTSPSFRALATVLGEMA